MLQQDFFVCIFIFLNLINTSDSDVKSGDGNFENESSKKEKLQKVQKSEDDLLKEVGFYDQLIGELSEYFEKNQGIIKKISEYFEEEELTEKNSEDNEEEELTEKNSEDNEEEEVIEKISEELKNWEKRVEFVKQGYEILKYPMENSFNDGLVSEKIKENFESKFNTINQLSSDFKRLQMALKVKSTTEEQEN